MWGMGDRWVQLLGYQLGVGELSKVEGVSYKELGVSESDMFICEGVGEGGGAGSAQRLVEGCGCGDDEPRHLAASTEMGDSSPHPLPVIERMGPVGECCTGRAGQGGPLLAKSGPPLHL